MARTHGFTKGEEIANASIHGIGMLLSFVALIILIVLSSIHGSALYIVSFTLFGVTMLLLYTSSTFVHALPRGKAKHVFEVLDHASIYFFIAGSYTPFLFIGLNGWLGWTLFCIVSSLAVGGTIFKCFFVGKYVFLSTLLYIIMGWMIVLAWHPLTAHVPEISARLLFLGGLFYTVGSIFFVWKGFKYHHAIWHFFVLVGSMAHFFSVLYLLP
ncbi:hemolysin III family protein [Terrilactibacillus sp. BCM23-1]|uniref:Hemolysin III family protein n=1 Tax=Terrilactibacillus tamarindi TaxID=2599694 RepID=A0A6N8CT22_9BACI|nr:hemolysin III family protein [Terrilactibacillus tamarindi]MTT33322.1 hemolysin III family protein [Terrilactibacillus tamarindi]